LPDQWKESIIVTIHKKGDKTGCSTYRGISLLSTSYNIIVGIILSRLSPYVDEILWITSVGVDVTDQLLIRFFAFIRSRDKWEYNETIHQLFIDFKKAYESVRREVLYNIHIDFGVPMKLVRLIKMCLNETYSKIHIGKHLSDNFSIQNFLK
jgi:hypothetical protein